MKNQDSTAIARSKRGQWRRIDPRTPLIGCPSCGAVVAELDKELHDKSHAA